MEAVSNTTEKNRARLAQSGAPLRAVYLSTAASPPPMYSSEAALSPPNPLSPCSCGKGTACHGKRGFKEKGIVG